MQERWPKDQAPLALNSVVAQALANIGYNLPAASLPVRPWVQPSLIVGSIPKTPTDYLVGSTFSVTRGNTWTFTVPANYTWEVITLGMDNVAGATTSYGTFQPYLQKSAGGSVIPWGIGLLTPGGASLAGEVLCGFTPPPLVLPAGTVIGIMYCGATDATGTAIITSAVIQRPAAPS